MEEKKNWSEFLLNYALYFILGIMILCVIIADPSFLSLNNFLKILAQASTRGILALGVAGMIVLAGTDLSAGRVLGCGAAISASLLQSVTYASRMYKGITEPLPLWVPLILSIVVCVAFCLVNGFGVAKLHMHAFIISLGTQLIAYGILCLYIDSQEGGAQPLASLDPRYIDLVNGRHILGIPNLVWFFLICAIVNVAKNIMLVYLVAGVLYGIAAFLEAARIQSVTTSTGLNYDLDAISGCVIGGVSFNGGIGTIPGVIIGVIILQVINYSLYYLGVNAYLQFVIKGLIIILAVAIDVRKYIAKK